MATYDDWGLDSAEAIRIRMRRHAHDNIEKPPLRDDYFHPNYMHFIFGEQEAIFGYKKLKINLTFACDTMLSDLKISYQSRFKDVGETKADDIEAMLAPYLPSKTPEARDQRASHPLYTTPFKPPGEKIHDYDLKDESFGIWKANLTDTMAMEVFKNMQILTPMFIDGGTLLDLDDPQWTLERWTVFFLYSIDLGPSPKNPPKYSLVGYATTYRVFFPDTTAAPPTPPMPSDAAVTSFDIPTLPNIAESLSSRQRISQFLILPGHHGKSHGSHLYDSMIALYLADDYIREITVEDPNEQFDTLRDLHDLKRLRTDTAFNSLSIDPACIISRKGHWPLVPRKSLTSTDPESLRAATKVPRRQYYRLVEMHLLSKIEYYHREVSRITRRDRCPNPKDRIYYFWRLLLKSRLFIQYCTSHGGSISSADGDDLPSKLDATLPGIEEEYTRILQKLEHGHIVDYRAPSPPKTLSEEDRRARAAAMIRRLNSRTSSPFPIKATARPVKRERSRQESDDDHDPGAVVASIERRKASEAASKASKASTTTMPTTRRKRQKVVADDDDDDSDDDHRVGHTTQSGDVDGAADRLSSGASSSSEEDEEGSSSEEGVPDEGPLDDLSSDQREDEFDVRQSRIFRKKNGLGSSYERDAGYGGD